MIINIRVIIQKVTMEFYKQNFSENWRKLNHYVRLGQALTRTRIQHCGTNWDIIWSRLGDFSNIFSANYRPNVLHRRWAEWSGRAIHMNHSLIMMPKCSRSILAYSSSFVSTRSCRSPFKVVVINRISLSVTRPPGVALEQMRRCLKCDSGEV